MAPPIYFLPKAARADLCPGGRRLLRPKLAELDLVRQLGDIRDARAELWLLDLTTRGPGGHSGLLLCALPFEQPPPPRLDYAPDFQTWTQLGEGLWAGLDNERTPTPADLRRRRPLLEGYSVPIAGTTWSVPVIRDPYGASGLPCDWHYTAEGEVEEKIRPEFREFWEKTADVADLFYGTDPDAKAARLADRPWIVERCLDALALNYRVGRYEQNLLGLVASDTWASILGATVDWLTFRGVTEEHNAKKNAPDTPEGSNPESTATAPGPPDASPATGPAAAS